MVEWMLILAGGVNRLVEFLKLGVITRLQARWNFSDDVYQASLVCLSLALGVFAAAVGGANALALVPENAYTGRIPEAAGIIAAGLLIGLGTNVIHEAGEFFAILKRPPVPPAPDLTPLPEAQLAVVESQYLTRDEFVRLSDQMLGEVRSAVAGAAAGNPVDDDWKPPTTGLN